MLRRTLAADAGMWALWDPARFARVKDYRAWKRELLHEADLLRHVGAGALVPINIPADAACDFEVRVCPPGGLATLTERESLYRAVSSQPFLLSSAGEICLGGVGDVGFGLPENIGALKAAPGRYSATVHLLDWKKEPGSLETDGGRRSGALPDLLALLNPAPARFKPEPTLDTFRQDDPPPSNPELLEAISRASGRTGDAFSGVLQVILRSTVILGAQKSQEGSPLSVPLPEDVEVPLLAVQADNGRRMLAVFTDVAALEARRPGCAWVAMAGGDALLHAVKANFDGIILNPAGPGLELPRDVLVRAV